MGRAVCAMHARAALVRLLAALICSAAVGHARLVVVTGRNDTYLFEDTQAVFGGGIPPLGITAQLVVCDPRMLKDGRDALCVNIFLFRRIMVIYR